MHNIYTHTYTKTFILDAINGLKALILMHKLQQNTYRGIFMVFQGTCTEQHFHNKVNVQENTVFPLYLAEKPKKTNINRCFYHTKSTKIEALDYYYVYAFSRCFKISPLHRNTTLTMVFAWCFTFPNMVNVQKNMVFPFLHADKSCIAWMHCTVSPFG